MLINVLGTVDTL